MKKTFIVLMSGILMLSSCATSNQQKIVGTWIDTEGQTWNFSTDGKLTYRNTDDEDRVYNYNIADAKLSFNLTDNKAAPDTLQMYDFSISADGNELILTGGTSVNGWIIAGPGWPKNQLTKK